MEITDLMLNDYVMIHCFDGSDIVIKVTRIEGESGTVYGISKQGSHWANIEDVRPIPLTTEILEKNGFVKSVSSPGIHAKCYELDNKDDRYCLTIANYNKYKRLLLNVDSEDAECFNMKCDYVHQLQHALKECKIKKEIVL